MGVELCMEEFIMKTMKTTLIVSALAMLGGCVAVPVGQGYPGPQAYYAPAPVYIAPPVVYGPSFGFGFYGGRGGYRHR